MSSQGLIVNTCSKHYFPKYSQSYSNRNLLKTEESPFWGLKSLTSQLLSEHVLSCPFCRPSCCLHVLWLFLLSNSDLHVTLTVMPIPVLILQSFLTPECNNKHFIKSSHVSSSILFALRMLTQLLKFIRALPWHCDPLMVWINSQSTTMIRYFLILSWVENSLALNVIPGTPNGSKLYMIGHQKRCNHTHTKKVF